LTAKPRFFRFMMRRKIPSQTRRCSHLRLPLRILKPVEAAGHTLPHRSVRHSNFEVCHA
jgi:hypothetical protein